MRRGPGRGNPTGEEAGHFQANCEVLFRCCPVLAASLPLSKGSLGWGRILKARWHTTHIKHTSDSLVLPCMYPSRPHTHAAPPTHRDPLPQASVTNTSHTPPPPCSLAHGSQPGGRSWGVLSSPGSSRSLGRPAPALGRLGGLSPHLQLPPSTLGKCLPLDSLFVFIEV